MKVAFYIGTLNRGGAETLLADILSQEVLPFDPVCVYRREGNLSEAFHGSSFPMVKIARKKSWLLYVWRLRQFFKREGVDVVHAQTSLNAIIAIICTLFTKIKVVNTFHGFSFAHAPKVLRWIVFKGCDRLVFVSQYEQDYYLQRGSFGAEGKCVVAYNGIRFEKFGLLAEPSTDNKPLNMCMVGSFGEGRNHLFVCQALKSLKDKGINYQFYFVGAARESERAIYDNCVSYCKEHELLEQVHFVGLSNEVPKLLLTMDAFLYATRHDSFGIAVIEAIASGLPTFVNDWDVMREITNEGDYATLYRTNDVDSVVNHIEQFANNRTRYWEQAHLAALSVREKYSIEQHIEKLNHQYCELMK